MLKVMLTWGNKSTSGGFMRNLGMIAGGMMLGGMLQMFGLGGSGFFDLFFWCIGECNFIWWFDYVR